MTKIAIIIPVYNEAEHIQTALLQIKNALSNNYLTEIIIVDGGSTDGTLGKIQLSETIKCMQTPKGRSKQMNAGAAIAKGEILYFLHCDSCPPQNFDVLIVEAVLNNKKAGCFRMKFDLKHPLLQVSQWFTRFNHISCRGGDQSLFVTKKIFESIGGFNESYTIYEDNEIIERLYAQKQFAVIQEYIVTSARKYIKNGVWKLQYHFAIIHLKKRFGQPTERLLAYYKKNIV